MSVIIDNSLTVAWFSLTKEARRPMQCCGDPDTNAHMWNATVQLADLYSLTIYDAAYLGMAQRRRMTLATLDAALVAAAKGAGVTTLP